MEEGRLLAIGLTMAVVWRYTGYENSLRYVSARGVFGLRASYLLHMAWRVMKALTEDMRLFS